MPVPAEQLSASLRAAGEFLTKRRPAAEIQHLFDYKIEIEGRALTILGVRPRFDDETKYVEHAVAKMKWVGTKRTWCLFWMRADLKWHSYAPLPEARSIAVLFAEVDRDPNGCFFG